MSEQPTTDEVTVHVDAPPERVYELVADVTRMGEWSPECQRCEWTGGATGPAVGAKFKASNKRGWMRWSNTPTVVAAEPGREFAFSRGGMGAGEVVWRYRFEPAGGGTDVTESYEVVRPAAAVATAVFNRVAGIKDRRAELRKGMEETLARVKQAAESSG